MLWMVGGGLGSIMKIASHGHGHSLADTMLFMLLYEKDK